MPVMPGGLIVEDGQLLTPVTSLPATPVAPPPSPPPVAPPPISTPASPTVAVASAPPSVASELPLPGGAAQIPGVFVAALPPLPKKPPPISSELPLPGGAAQIPGVFVPLPTSGASGGTSSGGGGEPDDPDFDAAQAEALANRPDNSDLTAPDVYDAFGLQFDAATHPPLKGGSALEAIAQACSDYGIDPLACVADAQGEGAGGGIGDKGKSYGPFQMEIGGALPEPYASHGLYNATTNAWAWSENGIRYAIHKMATANPSARGLRGHAAIYAMVYGFERPGDKPKAYHLRSGYYDVLLAKGKDWAVYAATLLAGPAGTDATDTSPQLPPSKTAARPTAVTSDWRDLLDVFITKLPEGHASIKSNSEGLVNIFR